MRQAHYVTENPTLAVSAPQEPEAESKELTDVQVRTLYSALEQRGDLRLRDTALLTVLSHGLRAEEASQLDAQEYDGKRLHIREAKAGSTGRVPLDQDARAVIDMYLEWRTEQGELLGLGTSLFINRSHDP
jgi:integrase/recombinase XerD